MRRERRFSKPRIRRRTSTWRTRARSVCRFDFTSDSGRASSKVILDTDIGTDIDDAFALALALVSPEIDVLGITTVSGDVGLRARLVDRFLFAAGRTGIPVAVGVEMPGPFDRRGNPVAFTQARWAQESPLPARPWPPAVPFIVEAVNRFPGEVTLLCIGPLTTAAAVLESDPAALRKLKRIVLMGGSMRVGFADGARPPQPPPVAEYNIVADISAAQRVFAAGVPTVVFPLDSTQVRLDRHRRERLFARGTPLTDALEQLYRQWRDLNAWGDTPTLYDVVALAYLIDPGLGPTEPMRVVVDPDGSTREERGAANVSVCMHADEAPLLELFMRRLLA